MAKTNDPREEDGRRGAPFSVRLTDDDRRHLELREKQSRDLRRAAQGGPRFYRSLGGFIVWAALQWKPAQGDLFPEAPAPQSKRKRRKPAKHAKRPARKGTTKRRKGRR